MEYNKIVAILTDPVDDYKVYGASDVVVVIALAIFAIIAGTLVIILHHL